MKNEKKKLPSILKLKKLADKIWSSKVDAIWGSKCAVCGATDNLNSHHIEPRTANAAIRWEQFNGIRLCVTHHKYGKDAAHKSCIFFYEFLFQNAPSLIETIRPLRSFEISAQKINREQITLIISYLWSDLTKEDEKILKGFSIEEINKKWNLNKGKIKLTIWEKDFLKETIEMNEIFWREQPF